MALAPTFTGHAVEVRLYAEDPAKQFAPQPGSVSRLSWPADLPGVRIDAGITQGSEVTPHYDPLLAKIIAHGSARAEAIARLLDALAATQLELVGPKGPRRTNKELLIAILRDSRFTSGQYDTGLAEAVVREASFGL